MDPQLVLDLQKFYPEIALTAGLLLVVLVDLALPRVRQAAFLLAILTLAVSFGFVVQSYGLGEARLFFGMLVLDPLSVFFKGFLVVSSLLVLLAAPGSKELARESLGEFYALLLGVTLGMLLLASSVDLLMLYLSLEMVSVGSYIMVAYLKNDRESNEASLKYLLFGAVSTGSMLYGITLLFGLTGSTHLDQIQGVLAAGAGEGANGLTLLVSTVLILAGFGFKTAAVPFHFWCPDVYTGAPTPVTAFLSVAPKAAGFAALIRFFFGALSQAGLDPGRWAAFSALNWTWLVLIISVITMTLGNLAALRQDNLKRLLAYSSIAHAGYILMGAVVLTSEGIQAILIYLVTYLFMNLGAFLIVIEIHNQTGSFNLQEYSGLFRRSPFLTIAMTVFLLSLMGIPPFAGFFGKLFVFGAAVNRDLAWYAVVGALNSVIAVYYYARVIRVMIIEDAREEDVMRLPWTSHVLVWLMLLPTSGLAIFWDKVQKLTGDALKQFGGG